MAKAFFYCCFLSFLIVTSYHTSTNLCPSMILPHINVRIAFSSSSSVSTMQGFNKHALDIFHSEISFSAFYKLNIISCITFLPLWNFEQSQNTISISEVVFIFEIQISKNIFACHVFMFLVFLNVALQRMQNKNVCLVFDQELEIKLST